LPILLKPGGTITVEVPHLLQLIAQRQFDTIYHEHFSYFSLHVLDRVFTRHGLRVFDVETLPTHGGSLRIHACHADDARPRSERCAAVATAERHVEACSRRGVRPGMPAADVRQALGAPDEVCWSYSRSPANRHYRVRVLCFADGRVVEIFRQWHRNH